MTGGTLTVNGTLNITSGGTGVVSITGGTFNGTGTVGLTGGAQDLTSNQSFYDLNIAGSGNKTMLGNITITHELLLTTNNLIVGSNTLTVGSATSGNGITRTNGKMTLATGSSLSFGGSWTQNDLSTLLTNAFPLTINNFTMTRNLCTIGLGTGHNLTVSGAFTLTAGDFLIGASLLTLNGAISGNINGSITGGSASDLTIGGSGSASMYFDLSTPETVGGSNSIRTFTYNRTSHPFVMLSSMRVRSSLIQAVNTAIQITTGPVQTLTIDAGTVTGANLIGNPNAILQINGGGNFNTLTFASSPMLGSLITNRFGGTVNMSSPITVGSIAFKQGVIVNPAGITVTGGAPGSVTQESSSSQLFGPLTRTIAPNTNAATYIWPVGKYYVPAQNLTFDNVTTGPDGNVLVRAEPFEGFSGGTTDATMSSLKTNNYWNATVISNAANLISVGKVSLVDSRVTSSDVIGYATSATGIYTSLGGNVAGFLNTSTSDSPVALGYYNFGTAASPCIDPTVATINATSTTNCGTVATTLSIATGTLNSATQWNWYRGSCDTNFVGSGTSIVVSPTATTTYFVRGEGGCIALGNCASVTITVNTPQIWYADADGDTFGNPNITQSACSQPNNYVSNNTDCDDTDNTKHATFSFFADGDGDGFGSITASSQCAVNAATPPAGYAVNNTDCNDNDNTSHQAFPFYADADSDTYGTGSLTAVCTASGTVAPAGYSLNNTDCNDGDDTVYQNGTFFVDADNDGYTNGATAVVCYGAANPLGYALTNIGIDCNDAIAAINPGHAEVLYNGADDNCDGQLDDGHQITTSLLASECNATLASIGSLIGIQTLAPGNLYTGYRIRATLNSQVQIIETNVPHFTMQEFPSYAYATTYTIDIQLQRNGIWLGYYGPTCQVSTPAVLAQGGATQVSPSQCGITLPKINTLIATTSLAGVTGYRFKVTNLTDIAGPNAVQTIDRTQNWFSLQMLARYNYGTTYRVEVAVKSGTGAFGGFGSPCEVSSPVTPSLVNCGGVVANGTAYISATSVAGATQYRFQITRQSDLASATFDRNTNFFTFNSVPAAVSSPGVLYAVRVAVYTAGTWSPFGDACEITSPGTAARYTPTAPTESTAFKATAYPNPFASEFAIDVTTSSDANVQVKVYDMLGKLIESREVKLSELDAQKVGDRYPSGVYNVIVSQGGIVKTLRVIKR